MATKSNKLNSNKNFELLISRKFFSLKTSNVQKPNNESLFQINFLASTQHTLILKGISKQSLTTVVNNVFIIK